MNKAIVLLSGGLDSTVSLAVKRNSYKDILALTFNYGQKAFKSELCAAKEISNFYNIKHKVIDLDWLGQISTSSLNTKEEIPTVLSTDLDNKNITQKSAKSVWVPNRNGLFVNIAACFADALNFNDIIIGANLEESKTFTDNTIQFINAENNSFSFSTNSNIKLIAPLINLTKKEIITEAIKLNVPFELIYSCYQNSEKHCGKCESCQRLKRALELNNRHDIINKIFN